MQPVAYLQSPTYNMHQRSTPDLLLPVLVTATISYRSRLHLSGNSQFGGILVDSFSSGDRGPVTSEHAGQIFVLLTKTWRSSATRASLVIKSPKWDTILRYFTTFDVTSRCSAMFLDTWRHLTTLDGTKDNWWQFKGNLGARVAPSWSHRRDVFVNQS